MSRNQPRRFRQVFSRDLREFAESEFLGSITTSPFGVAIEFLYQSAEGLEVLRSSQELRPPTDRRFRLKVPHAVETPPHAVETPAPMNLL